MATPKPIKRLLVANRGEIATRIISAALELDIETIAVYTENDITHTRGASQTIRLPSPASYLDIDYLINLAKKHNIDAIHPGYGFLSESADFARRANQAGILVVGPGADILETTGDKLQARKLADANDVPVLAALSSPTNSISTLQSFASQVGYPVMIKAVDGGGGRGIRLVRSADELEGAAKRAIEESPSKQVFAEQAAVDGFLHVEIQIIGDGRSVAHLWERQCSIQRRYQKVVEVAPCVDVDRSFVATIIEAALKMAKSVNYRSLGTFEFLANPSTKAFYFLEVNPRLQVEHTITESISNVDIVQAQLAIAQGASLSEAGVPLANRASTVPSPPRFSCQLRVTAENVSSNWCLSIGKIGSFQLPSGNGVRVDTNLVSTQPFTVTSDFDSLLAKIIVTASTWEGVVRKARRALADTNISGVKTNIQILRGIVHHPDFAREDCDTQWLERHTATLQKAGEAITTALPASIRSSTASTGASPSTAVALTSSSAALRPGDAWSLQMAPKETESKSEGVTHHLQLTKILRNEFPSALSANILYTTPGSTPQPYTLTMSSTSASAAASTSTARKGDPNNHAHVSNPFPGKLVELLVDSGDYVKSGDVIAIVQQMKMELEVRCRLAGTIEWVTGVEDGEEIGEGVLLAIIAEAKGRIAESKL